MKVILTGATGFVGSELLARLSARPDIEAVTCLVRRAPDACPPKAVVIRHEDFTRYDEALLDALADHSACIWSLGGKASDLGRPEVLERVTHTFTIAFARAMAGRAMAGGAMAGGTMDGRAHGRFAYCYLSGMGADPTETARFPWERATRHLKGRTERDLATLQREHAGFSAHSFRPGGILPTGAPGLYDYLLAPLVVRVADLAEAMIVAAVEPRFFRKAPLLRNADIKRLARGAWVPSSSHA